VAGSPVYGRDAERFCLLRMIGAYQRGIVMLAGGVSCCADAIARSDFLGRGGSDVIGSVELRLCDRKGLYGKGLTPKRSILRAGVHDGTIFNELV